ncbi:MAG TPA: hypothetical protein DCW46_04655 [Desulfotomaculum sp.]|nr:hypothetical protein [Desulfotomaculum sp.]
MVPLKFITETLGATIKWDNQIKQVNVYLYSTELKPEEVINLYCQFLSGGQYGMAFGYLNV